MKKIFDAKINWLYEKDGGRRVVPYFDQFRTVVKVIKPSPKTEDETHFWSFIVEHVKFISERETIAKVYYLVDEAPANLAIGTIFELYDGRLVATGIII